MQPVPFRLRQANESSNVVFHTHTHASQEVGAHLAVLARALQQRLEPGDFVIDRMQQAVNVQAGGSVLREAQVRT